MIIAQNLLFGKLAVSVALGFTAYVIDTTLHNVIGQKGRRAGRAASWLTAVLTERERPGQGSNELWQKPDAQEHPEFWCTLFGEMFRSCSPDFKLTLKARKGASTARPHLQSVWVRLCSCGCPEVEAHGVSVPPLRFLSTPGWSSTARSAEPRTPYCGVSYRNESGEFPSDELNMGFWEMHARRTQKEGALLLPQSCCLPAGNRAWGGRGITCLTPTAAHRQKLSIGEQGWEEKKEKETEKRVRSWRYPSRRPGTSQPRVPAEGWGHTELVTASSPRTGRSPWAGRCRTCPARARAWRTTRPHPGTAGDRLPEPANAHGPELGPRRSPQPQHGGAPRRSPAAAVPPSPREPHGSRIPSRFLIHPAPGGAGRGAPSGGCRRARGARCQHSPLPRGRRRVPDAIPAESETETERQSSARRRNPARRSPPRAPPKGARSPAAAELRPGGLRCCERPAPQPCPLQPRPSGSPVLHPRPERCC